MKNRNKILDFADIYNTYKSRIPKTQLKILETRKWLPIRLNSNFASECAYFIGKIMGEGHLNYQYCPYFIGQEKEITKLGKHIPASVHRVIVKNKNAEEGI